MEKIKDLVRSLSTKEISAIRKYFDFNVSGEDNFKLILFDKIVKGLIKDDKAAANFLSKKPSDPAYIMLKKRLREDILKVLVWRDDLIKFKSKYFEARYKCRLLITQADILILKGATQIAIDCLNKAKKLADHYELTNEVLIINDLLISQVALKSGYEAYSHIADSSRSNIKLLQDKFDAQDYLRQLTMPNLFKVNKDSNFKEESSNANKILKQLSEMNSSSEIDFWYLRSEVFIHHIENNYEGAYKYALEFLKLVRKSPVVFSMDNIGGACMQLAIITIHLNDLENAKIYSKEAIDSFVKGSNNQLNAYSYLFLTKLYQKDFYKADLIIENILTSNSFKLAEFSKSKWNYYKANLLFAQGKYDDALALLQRENELISDKSGWRLGFKILEMMCIIELGYYDWLDFRIETFRKLLSDVKNENVSRPKLVLQIIKGFIKHMYDFKTSTIDLKEHFDLLASNDAEYKWDPIGYEVIPFHKWWYNKIASDKEVA